MTRSDLAEEFVTLCGLPGPRTVLEKVTAGDIGCSGGEGAQNYQARAGFSRIKKIP